MVKILVTTNFHPSEQAAVPVAEKVAQGLKSIGYTVLEEALPFNSSNLALALESGRPPTIGEFDFIAGMRFKRVRGLAIRSRADVVIDFHTTPPSYAGWKSRKGKPVLDIELVNLSTPEIPGSPIHFGVEIRAPYRDMGEKAREGIIKNIGHLLDKYHLTAKEYYLQYSDPKSFSSLGLSVDSLAKGIVSVLDKRIKGRIKGKFVSCDNREVIRFGVRNRKKVMRRSFIRR